MEFPSEQILIDEKPYKVKVASTPGERRIGLMDTVDIGADGMLFSYDYPVYRPFYMSRTILPLVIAFFDNDGHFMGSRTMTPLSEKPVLAPGPFRYAIEFHAAKVPDLVAKVSRLKRPMKHKESVYAGLRLLQSDSAA